MGGGNGGCSDDYDDDNGGSDEADIVGFGISDDAVNDGEEDDFIIALLFIMLCIIFCIVKVCQQ